MNDLYLWRVTFRRWVKRPDSTWELKPQETVLTVARGQMEAAGRVRESQTGATADVPTEIINAEKQEPIVGVWVDTWPRAKDAPRV